MCQSTGLAARKMARAIEREVKHKPGTAPRGEPMFWIVHALDDAAARRFPRTAIGRVLTQSEAHELLEKISRRSC